MRTFFAYVDGSGVIGISLTRQDVYSAYHPGQCDDDVKALLKKPYIKRQLAVIDPNKLRCAIGDFGIETDDMDLDTLKLYVVWLAAGAIYDDNDF